MKPERKEVIRRKHNCPIPMLTCFVCELLIALDEAEKRLGLVDAEFIDAIEAANKRENEFIRGVQEREDERKERI